MEIDGREPATLIILGVVATVVTFAGAAIYIYKTGKRYLKVIRMD